MNHTGFTVEALGRRGARKVKTYRYKGDAIRKFYERVKNGMAHGYRVVDEEGTIVKYDLGKGVRYKNQDDLDLYGEGVR